MVTSNYVEGFSERTPFSCMKKKVLNIIDLRAWMKVFDRFVKIPGNENFLLKHLELKWKNMKVVTKEVGVYTFCFNNARTCIFS